MQGCGNDYVYIDATKEIPEDASQLAIRVSDRHYGIGSDGLIMICSSEVADFRMVMFNADGSESEMCGNGIRCFGKFVYDHGLTEQKELAIETLAGIKYLKLIEEVDRTEFGTHLDVVNMITSPQKYFFNDEFLHECFEKLKGTICSCHLKDIRLKEEYTFQLEECACGQGTLDLELYARLADVENPDMPMIIEHLTTDEEYATSVKYVRNRLRLV